MNFEEATKTLLEGKKVRLPEWRGYWFNDAKQNTMALTKDGDVKPAWVDKDAWIGSGQERTDWEIAEGLDFGWAMCALTAGKMVTRKGWNGKGMFVFRQVPATINREIVPKMQSLPQSVKDEFEKRFNDPGQQIDAIYYDNQLALVNQSNLINGWAPSVSDTMAQDWELFG